MSIDCIDKIIEYIEKNLSEEKLKHTYGVSKEAVSLAEIYSCDKRKAEFAALCHDMFRWQSVSESDDFILKHGLPKKYLGNVNLAHSKIAAYVVKNEYQVDDMDIINAISYHTTGRKNMSILEKIIYVADAVEPNRCYKGIGELKKLAIKDINKAMIKIMDNSINYIKKRGLYLDNDTIEARKYLEKEILNGK